MVACGFIADIFFSFSYLLYSPLADDPIAITSTYIPLFCPGNSSHRNTSHRLANSSHSSSHGSDTSKLLQYIHSTHY